MPFRCKQLIIVFLIFCFIFSPILSTETNAVSWADPAPSTSAIPFSIEIIRLQRTDSTTGSYYYSTYSTNPRMQNGKIYYSIKLGVPSLANVNAYYGTRMQDGDTININLTWTNIADKTALDIPVSMENGYSRTLWFDGSSFSTSGSATNNNAGCDNEHIITESVIDTTKIVSFKVTLEARGELEDILIDGCFHVSPLSIDTITPYGETNPTSINGYYIWGDCMYYGVVFATDDTGHIIKSYVAAKNSDDTINALYEQTSVTSMPGGNEATMLNCINHVYALLGFTFAGISAYNVYLTDETILANFGFYLSLSTEAGWCLPTAIDLDKTPPQIDEVSIDKQGQTVKPGDIVTIHCEITDASDISRISSTCIRIGSTSVGGKYDSISADCNPDSTVSALVSWGPAPTIDPNQTPAPPAQPVQHEYVLTFAVPQDVKNGTWYLSNLSACDTSGNCNNVSFSSDKIHQFSITGAISELTPPQISDVSIDKQGQTLIPGDEIIIKCKILDASNIGDCIPFFYLNGQSYVSFEKIGVMKRIDSDYYTIKYRVPLSAKSGEWVLKGMVCFDQYDNIEQATLKGDCSVFVENSRLLNIETFNLARDSENAEYYRTSENYASNVSSGSEVFFAIKVTIPSAEQLNSNYHFDNNFFKGDSVLVSLYSNNLESKISYSQDVELDDEPQVLWYNGTSFSSSGNDTAVTNCGCDREHILRGLTQNSTSGISAVLRIRSAIQDTTYSSNKRYTIQNQTYIIPSTDAAPVIANGYLFTPADSQIAVFCQIDGYGRITSVYAINKNQQKQWSMFSLMSNGLSRYYPCITSPERLFGWNRDYGRELNSLITQKSHSATFKDVEINYDDNTPVMIAGNVDAYNFSVVNSDTECRIESDGIVKPVNTVNPQDWETFAENYYFQGTSIGEEDYKLLYYYNRQNKKYTTFGSDFWNDILQNTDGSLYYKLDSNAPSNPLILESDGFAIRDDTVEQPFSNTYVRKQSGDGTALNKMVSETEVNNDNGNREYLAEINTFFSICDFSYSSIAAGNVYLDESILIRIFGVSDTIGDSIHWGISRYDKDIGTDDEQSSGTYYPDSIKYESEGAAAGNALNDGSLEFTIHADYDKQTGATCDGLLLQKGVHYFVRPGSTIVTLSPEYLATLKDGQHTLRVYFTDGSADIGFTTPISKTSAIVSIPATNGASFGALFCLCIAAACWYYRKWILNRRLRKR